MYPPYCTLDFDPPTGLSLCFRFDAYLQHELLLHGDALLLGRVLHGLLRRIDAGMVHSVPVVDAKDPVPPSEGSRKVVGERHVVEIMVLSTRPELRILCNDQGKSEDYLNTQ
jgi:hypothetical protein